MVIGTCPYEDCDHVRSTPVGGSVPSWSRETCKGCNRDYWLKYSRLNPEVFTLEQFARLELSKLWGGNGQARLQAEAAKTPMRWKHLDAERPAIGQRVLVWHPDFEHLLCRFGGEGAFYEAARGAIMSYPTLKWWQPLSKPPHIPSR